MNTDITWLDARPVSATCPACGSEPATSVLSVPDSVQDAVTWTLLRCDACGTNHYADTAKMVGYDSEALSPGLWDYYLHIGTGIDVMLRPLLAAQPREGTRLLEVGCGFGFVLGYWQRYLRGEAVGIESAAYGSAGRDALGVSIHAERLEQCTALQGERFDYVYGSEVIEHVADPLAFIAQLKASLVPGGVLALTTRAAEFVSRENEEGADLVGALFPGFHYFLLSVPAMEDLLRRAGFMHAKVLRFHATLIAWASDQPISVNFSEQGAPPHYLEYLQHLSTLPDPNLRMGALYRQFKELVNQGRYDEAKTPYAALLGDVKARYGFSVHDASAVLDATGISDFERYGKRYPYFLPALLYYGAMFEGNFLGNQISRTLLFELAYRTVVHFVTNWKTAAQEAASLRDPALYHAFQSALARSVSLSPLVLQGAGDDTDLHMNRSWQQRARQDAMRTVRAILTRMVRGFVSGGRGSRGRKVP